MKENKKYEKYIYILITVFITWMIVGIAYSSKETELKETISSQNETIAELKEKIEDKDSQINDKEFECDYILNKNTKKFHHVWCSSVKQMKSSNTKEFTGTRDEVIDMGYSPCKRCNP